MRRKNVNTGSPWEQKIGYSRAVRVGTTVHVSATAGLDEASSGIAKGDAYSQARRALSWISAAPPRSPRRRAIAPAEPAEPRASKAC